MTESGQINRHQIVSRVVLAVAGLTIVLNALLTSPGSFSQRHLEDESLFRPIVTALALGGSYPTQRGVEIRQLVFYTGAAALALIGAIYLIIDAGRWRLSVDTVLDVRRHATRPYFWWLVLVVASALSSQFGYSPEACRGGMIVRLLQFAWWYPLAVLLSPRDARRLLVIVVATLATTAALGLWYHASRVAPHVSGGRLQYPLGNELWMAAFLLPGIFLAAGLIVFIVRRPGGAARRRAIDGAALALAGALTLAALAMTRSRSAAVGALAGVVAMLLFGMPRRRRLGTLLVVLMPAIAGAWVVQDWREHGSVAHRAHSIRARLDYEWPYAIRLFMARPIGGHGEGAYAMLAGQFAREDQLDDPSVLRFDEATWTGHAHNEFLELAADVGLTGTVAFALALATVIRLAMRRIDEASRTAGGDPARWVSIGAAGALVAGVVEACGTPALRQPGVAPVFLAVWASLAALVTRSPTATEDSPKGATGGIAPGWIRLAGIALAVAAVMLGGFGIRDWRAARGFYQARAAMESGGFEEAVAGADDAAQHSLDAFQKCSARVYAAWARSLAFDRRLGASDAAPSDDDMAIAHAALGGLNRLQRDAPRFLMASRIAADLNLNLSRAHERRGESGRAAECGQQFVTLLEQSRRDEPFSLERVVALWRTAPGTMVVERLKWLKALIRKGEMDNVAISLFAELARLDGFDATMAEMQKFASEDMQRPPRQWQDLTPESFRLVGLYQAMTGRFEQAAVAARQAADLYERAGSRLFAAHSAALNEVVKYEFALDPVGRTDALLEQIAGAYGLIVGPTSPDDPVRDELAETRLRVLLAAGRDDEAQSQAAVITGGDEVKSSAIMAEACARLALSFVARDALRERVEHWSQRANELDPVIVEPYVLLGEFALARGDDAAAVNTLRRMTTVVRLDELTRRRLVALKQMLPGAAIWNVVARDFPQWNVQVEPSPASAPDGAEE